MLKIFEKAVPKIMDSKTSNILDIKIAIIAFFGSQDKISLAIISSLFLFFLGKSTS